MTPDADVAALLESVTATPAAFGAVFDEHAAVIYRYLARRVHAEDAAEILSEVFRIAFERRGDFDPERGTVRPWLYGIATHLLANHRRAEARRFRAMARLRAGEAPLPDSSEATISSVDAARRWPVVLAAIAALPDAERDTLLLFAWEDLGYDEIATALGIPIGTVRSRLNRARRRLENSATTPTNKMNKMNKMRRKRTWRTG